jgi:hypothetical protein
MEFASLIDGAKEPTLRASINNRTPTRRENGFALCDGASSPRREV